MEESLGLGTPFGSGCRLRAGSCADGLGAALNTGRSACWRRSRPPGLLEGRRAGERLAGAREAELLAVTRPLGVLLNKLPNELRARMSGRP